jgi:hypothetical protein
MTSSARRSDRDRVRSRNSLTEMLRTPKLAAHARAVEPSPTHSYREPSATNSTPGLFCLVRCLVTCLDQGAPTLNPTTRRALCPNAPGRSGIRGRTSSENAASRDRHAARGRGAWCAHPVEARRGGGAVGRSSHTDSFPISPRIVGVLATLLPKPGRAKRPRLAPSDRSSCESVVTGATS